MDKYDKEEEQKKYVESDEYRNQQK